MTTAEVTLSTLWLLACVATGVLAFWCGRHAGCSHVSKETMEHYRQSEQEAHRIARHAEAVLQEYQQEVALKVRSVLTAEEWSQLSGEIGDAIMRLPVAPYWTR